MPTATGKPRHVERPPFARHGRVNSRPATADKLATASRRGSALAPFVGAQKYYRIFWVKLFVARFWHDIKEWEAVCVNYFCEVVPFWEWGGEMTAESLQVLKTERFCACWI